MFIQRIKRQHFVCIFILDKCYMHFVNATDAYNKINIM